MKKQKIFLKPLRVSSFFALKKVAYQAAFAGKEYGYNTEWKKLYIECYPPSSLVFLFERVVTVYKDFFQNAIKKEEGMRLLQELEEKFERLNTIIGSTMDFIKAAEEAFENSGEPFGKVEFNCPNCYSKAKAIRLSTPENPTHSVTIRAACNGCGTAMMN